MLLESGGHRAAVRFRFFFELMSVLKIDRSSVFRLANTLQRRGFLAQLPDSKRYTLGLSIWRLSGLFHFEKLLLEVAQPHIRALAEDTGETTHVAIRDGCQAVLIDRRLTLKAVGVAGVQAQAPTCLCTVAAWEKH